MNTFILILIWCTMKGEINVGYEGEDQPTIMNQNECNDMLARKSKEAILVKDVKWVVGGCVNVPIGQPV